MSNIVEEINAVIQGIASIIFRPIIDFSIVVLIVGIVYILLMRAKGTNG